MRRALILAAALIAATAAPAAAKDGKVDPVDELVEIDGKKGITIRPDRAYFLIRVQGKWFMPTFMRVPTPVEVADYYAAKAKAFDQALPDLKKARDAALAKHRAAAAAKKKFDGEIPPEPSLENFDYHHDAVQNLQSINGGKALVKGKADRTMLIEAIPGSYIIYGVGGPGAMMTCLCLGTVGFEAKAGEITDLGRFHSDIAWQPAKDPLLAAESNLGASVNGHWVLPAVAVVPPTADAVVPAPLGGKPIVAARYHAVGKFVGPPVFSINRLAPIPGILSYQRGTVIDGSSGAAVPNQF